MRAFFSHEFMPSIHYSSFEAGSRSPPSRGDPLVAGFLEQTRNVLVGVDASIERALQEGWSMVLEGVHLVPGMLPREIESALVVHCVLAIDDEEAHARTSSATRARRAARRWTKYLDRFDEIRRLQRYIVERAERDRRAGDRERRTPSVRPAR